MYSPNHQFRSESVYRHSEDSQNSGLHHGYRKINLRALTQQSNLLFLCVIVAFLLSAIVGTARNSTPPRTSQTQGAILYAYAQK